MDGRPRPVLLDHLRATGNVAASARAAGFTPRSAWNRRDRLAGFARKMEEAREDADLGLEFELIVQASEGKGDDFGGGPQARAGRDQAMRTLRFRENRWEGRHGARRGAPPTIEAVTAKIEKAVRAVRRQRTKAPPK